MEGYNGAAGSMPPSDSDGGGKLRLFLLAGQSNMAGRGGTFVLSEEGSRQAGVRFDGVFQEECQPMPGKIFAFDASGAWVTAAEPLHDGIDTTKACGIGPGMAFARSLILRSAPDEATPSSIGLVPSAVGNTSIDEWAVGGDLFSRAVRRTQAALLSSQPQQGRLSGILWYQGESDAINEEKALNYRQKLLGVLEGFRDAFLSSRLPIVQVAIHTTRAALPYTEDIRKVQTGLVLEGMGTVDAREHCTIADRDLPDELHLSTRAQCSLGQAMAECFVALTASNDGTPPL